MTMNRKYKSSDWLIVHCEYDGAYDEYDALIETCFEDSYQVILLPIRKLVTITDQHVVKKLGTLKDLTENEKWSRLLKDYDYK
jgi:hypothetical protein